MAPSQLYRDEQRPLNVLAIDGGGARGLSSLLILQRIMGQLKIAVRSDSPLLPCQIFDIICGTSTGGLIAIMLGRLRMNADEAIVHYLAICKAVFGIPKICGWLRNVTGSPMYSASTLKKSVKKIVAKFDATKDGPLQDPLEKSGKNYCRTFVVAIRQDRAEAPAELFRSYPMETSSTDTYTIWESVRATTAASRFFKPAKVGTPPIKYLDGDLVANNPSKLACQEARRLFDDRPIGCFLSLGTGSLNVIKVKGNLFKIANVLQKLAKNCEEVADEVRGMLRIQSEKRGLPNPFFRFSVNGLEDIKLHQWAVDSKVAGITSGYIGFREVELRRCVEVLKARADLIMMQGETDPLC